MKILVTGGAGFIGSNIVGALLRQHHDITVLDSFLSGYRQNLLPYKNIRLIEGDVRDEYTVNEAIRGIEIVFHLAASVGNKRSIDFPLEDADINVRGTLQLLEAARKSQVKKIVTSSSAGIYGELKYIPIVEDHPVEPDSPYGCTKLCEEKLCLAYGKLYGVEVVCLRYFNVYGPNQRFDAYGNVIPIFVFNALRNKDIIIFGDGEQTRDFVNVADVVQANIQAAMAKGVSGAFNVASGTRVSINSLARIIVEQTKAAVSIKYGSPRDGDVRDSLAEIGAARRMFGYNPSVDLINGLTEYIAWAKTENANSHNNALQ